MGGAGRGGPGPNYLPVVVLSPLRVVLLPPQKEIPGIVRRRTLGGRTMVRYPTRYYTSQILTRKTTVGMVVLYTSPPPFAARTLTDFIPFGWSVLHTYPPPLLAAGTQFFILTHHPLLPAHSSSYLPTTPCCPHALAYFIYFVVYSTLLLGAETVPPPKLGNLKKSPPPS